MILDRLKLAIDICKATSNWPIVFLNYFGLINRNFIVFKFKDGSQIIIERGNKEGETSGFATIWEIFVKETYNPRGFKIKDDDIVVDIGANIGIFSIYAAKRAKRGKVYSFEPFLPHYTRLKNNIGLNKLNNITAYNLAVSNKKGKSRFFISNISSGMHSLYRLEKTKQRSVHVKKISFNEFILRSKIQKIDFLKLDCEGSEYDILYSLSKSNLGKIKKVSLEFEELNNEKNNSSYLKKFLNKAGFHVYIDKINDKEKMGRMYAHK